MIFGKKLSFMGLAAIIICAVTPIMRLTFGGAGIMSLSSPVILLFVLLGIINKQEKIRFSYFQKFVIGLCIMSLFYSYIFPLFLRDYETDLLADSRKIQYIVMLLFVYLSSRKELNVIIALNFVVSFYFLYCLMFKEVFYGGEGRYYIVLQEGVNMDPNMTVAAFFIPSIFCFIEIFKKNRFWVKLIAITYMGFSLYATLLGASRSGFLSIMIGFAMAILYSDISKKRKRLLLVISLIIVCLLLLLVSVYVSDEIMTRMTVSSVLDTGGSGRFDLASEYLSYFTSSSIFYVLFGHGWSSCLVLLGMSAHNTMIEYLMDFGLVGLGFILYFIISLFKYVFSSKNNLAIAVLCSTIFWCLTISANNLLQFWVLLYFVLSLSHVQYEDNKKNTVCNTEYSWRGY